MIEFWVPSDLGMPVPCWGWGIPNFSGTPEGQLSGQQGEILPPKAPQTQWNIATLKWHQHVGDVVQGYSDFGAKLCGLRESLQ